MYLKREEKHEHATGHAHHAATASSSIVATTHLPTSPYIRGFEGDAAERSGQCLNRADYGALHTRKQVNVMEDLASGGKKWI